jgi:hypothetical protein
MSYDCGHPQDNKSTCDFSLMPCVLLFYYQSQQLHNGHRHSQHEFPQYGLRIRAAYCGQDDLL